MIEIIVLIFLTKEIGILALQKGLKAGRWKFYLVIGWILGEFLGLIIGVMIFGQDNIVSVMLTAIAVAVSSYFIIKSYLNKLPDYMDEEEIDRIGR